MKDDQLINKKYHILQRKKIFKDPEKFIYTEIATRINQSLEGINFSVKECLEIGYSTNNINHYVSSRFKNVDYTTLEFCSDLSKAIPKSIKTYNFDHDNWSLSEKKFDLIISNFYLHLTNNLGELINNINISLNKDGFFIAAIPGNNCFRELRDTMIFTDLELYGGAYKRFKETYLVKDINNILKNSNFEIPVIDFDTLYLKYSDFKKLLLDVRNLGCSYILNDRKKKFEKKNYFKKAEEIYWKKFSKNNKLILQLEIMYFSGWKKNTKTYNPH